MQTTSTDENRVSPLSAPLSAPTTPAETYSAPVPAPAPAPASTVSVAITTSVTDAFVELICAGYLTSFTNGEAVEMLGCGSYSSEEIGDKRLPGAARVHTADGQTTIVVNPHAICEGLISAFTPLGQESNRIFQVAHIVSISFTE